MYKIETQKLSCILNEIYDSFFHGFDKLEVIQFSQNKKIEHFFEPDLPSYFSPLGHILLNKEEKKERIKSIKKLENAYSYHIGKKKRFNILSNAFAHGLGFNSIEELLEKNKDKENEFVDFKDITLKDFKKFKVDFLKYINKEFKFEYPITKVRQNWFEMQMTQSVIDFKKDNDITKTKRFIYFKYNFDFKRDSLNDSFSFLYANKLHCDFDLYDNDNHLFEVVNKAKIKNIDLSFFNKINYLFEINNIKDDIKNISDENYSFIYEYLLEYVNIMVLQSIQAIRDNREDSSSIIELNSYLQNLFDYDTESFNI